MTLTRQTPDLMQDIIKGHFNNILRKIWVRTAQDLYVCLSVTGLRLKYTSLRIVHVPSGTCPSWCAKLTRSSRYDGRLQRRDDDARLENALEVQKTFK